MYDQDDMHGEFRQRNPMASASIALGIVSLLSCTIFYIAIPCGALAVLCAILSRGRFRLSGKGKAGIVCGIIGMILSAVVTVTAVHTVLNTPAMKARLEQALQLYLGDPTFDLDKTLNSLIPALGGSENDPLPAADETEAETENRVRLRVAEDTDQTEAASEASSEISSDTDKAPEKDTAADIAETENKADDTEETEHRAKDSEDQAPVTIPSGGGAFI